MTDNEVRKFFISSSITAFSKFTTWPKQDTLTKFKIGILGSNNKDLFEKLKKEAATTNFDNYLATSRNLTKEIILFNSLEEIIPTQLLFVDGNSGFDIYKVYEKISGRGTLLLSDRSEDFNITMVNFTNEGKRPQYTLNRTNLEKENFILDSILIKNAVRNLDENNDVYIKLKKLTLSKNNLIEVNKEDLIQIIKDHQTEGENILDQKDVVQQQKSLLNSKDYQFDIVNQIHQKTISDQKQEIKLQEARSEELASNINSKLLLLTTQEKEIAQKSETLENQKIKMNQQADNIEKQGDILNQQTSEIQRQRTVIYLSVFVILLVLAFVFFIYRNYREKKKANIEITKQKHLLEQKNKEITDSIEYALRIQTAILPPQKIVKQYLENSFILYKPKDIVAGDFYWMETINDLVLFAACDCTGHGVPGAMVSVVCHNALNRAVREFGLIQPSAILDKTAELVIENFAKSEEDIKDGMDISLCAYNSKTKTIQWAGANNALWIIKNNELIETKADKQPIGMNEDSKPFTNHSFVLNSGDSLYLFTDGFADQFGGETGDKKLTRKRFKELLLGIQGKSMQNQGVELDKFIVNYRKEVEQIDDILVIGVTV